MFWFKKKTKVNEEEIKRLILKVLATDEMSSAISSSVEEKFYKYTEQNFHYIMSHVIRESIDTLCKSEEFLKEVLRLFGDHESLFQERLKEEIKRYTAEKLTYRYDVSEKLDEALKENAAKLIRSHIDGFMGF